MKQQHAQGNLPHSQLRHHQSFNEPASSSGLHGQNKVWTPKRTPSHGAQVLSNHHPRIRISLDPGAPLDLGLKQEISQQVREFRAQKLNQRESSPGPIQKHNQSAGQGPRKEASKSHKEHSSQGPASQSKGDPVGQSNKIPNPYPLGPSNQKEKPRDRPLSAPSQAAIQALKSVDPQLKALQPHPQSPRQVQKPPLGSNPAFTPAVRLVSHRPRNKSHSPRRRVDVDVEPEHQVGRQKGMRAAISHETLLVPPYWDVTPCDSDDPLSQSYPDNALNCALARQRNSYSPGSSSGNFLQVPDNNVLHFPPQQSTSGRNAEMSSTPRSASSPENIHKPDLAGVRLWHSSSALCLLSSSPTLGLPPQSFLQNSPPSPLSSSLVSINTSPHQLSPDSPMSSSARQSAHIQLTVPTHILFPSHFSPGCSPHCSPYGSPFGSQNQIYITSVGPEA